MRFVKERGTQSGWLQEYKWIIWAEAALWPMIQLGIFG